MAALNEIRLGRWNSPLVVELFERCNRPMDLPNGVVPTIIYCRNKDVARENRTCLALLPAEAESSTFLCNKVYYRDGDGGGLTVIEGRDLEIRDRVFPVEHFITLKVGAPLLLCKYMDATHVNGSRGVVSGFVQLAVFRDPATMLLKYVTTEELVEDAPADELTLDEEQQHALELVKKGKNVFITGCAGTGKTVVVRKIVEWLDESVDRHVVVLTSTGVTAYNLGPEVRAYMIHSYFGLGLKATVKSVHARGRAIRD